MVEDVGVATMARHNGNSWHNEFPPTWIVFFRRIRKKPIHVGGNSNSLCRSFVQSFMHGAPALHLLVTRMDTTEKDDSGPTISLFGSHPLGGC